MSRSWGATPARDHGSCARSRGGKGRDDGGLLAQHGDAGVREAEEGEAAQAHERKVRSHAQLGAHARGVRGSGVSGWPWAGAQARQGAGSTETKSLRER